MKSFSQFINESLSAEEKEALLYLHKVGLLTDADLVKQIFELDPSLVGVAEIVWNVDWGWASQHESSDLEEILDHWFSTQGDPLPAGAVLQLDSLDVDQWTEEDFWEEEEEEDGDDDEEREVNMVPIYGSSPSVRIKVLFMQGVDVSSIEEWAEGWSGRILDSDPEVEIEQEPKISI